MYSLGLPVLPNFRYSSRLSSRTFQNTKHILSLNNESIRNSSSNTTSSSSSPERAFRDRLQEINNACPDPYPRLASDNRSVSCSEFRSRYSHLANDQIVEEDSVVVRGRSQPDLT